MAIFRKRGSLLGRGESGEGSSGSILEVIVTIAVALGIAFAIQALLVKPYRIPSGSMENTLRCGDRVLVDRISYRFSKPGRGDVVVFHPPAGVDEDGNPDPTSIAGEFDTGAGGDGKKDKPKGKTTVQRADVNYIKRIIGLPGDKVEVRRHRAWINGKKLKEPYLHPLPDDDLVASAGEFGPVTVPKGTYLMLGDHRNHSQDGRFFGFVPRDFIIGKAFGVYWPMKRVGGLPGSDPGGTSDAKPDPNCIETIPAEGEE